VDPTSNVCCPYKRKEREAGNTERHKGKVCLADQGRDWSDVATSQGMLRIAPAATRSWEKV